MSRIVVLGAGVCGLAAALMLRRDGHEVTVLERDAAPLPDSAADAWHSWEREGVRQFRQAHFLQPLGAGVLDAELPDVRDAALAEGAAHFSVLPDVFPYEPGDERFRTFIMRRAVLEHTLARIAEDEVDVRRGVVATGLVSNGRVTGVRTQDGELAADLVVDAMGRRSPLSQWRDDVHEEADDSGFLYYSRFFRGAQPEILAPLLSEAGTISFLTLPGDNGTWSVTLFVSAGDQPLKRVRETDRWSAVVAASPAHAHWLDGEPTSEIEAMGGINDRFRRLAPGTLGLALLADACACTNPSNGRGLALGLRHAQQLRDAARNEDPRALRGSVRRRDRGGTRAVVPHHGARGSRAAGRDRGAARRTHAGPHLGIDPGRRRPVRSGAAARLPRPALLPRRRRCARTAGARRAHRRVRGGGGAATAARAGPSDPARPAHVKRLTNDSAVSATSCQPESIVSA